MTADTTAPARTPVLVRAADVETRDHVPGRTAAYPDVVKSKHVMPGGQIGLLIGRRGRKVGHLHLHDPDDMVTVLR